MLFFDIDGTIIFHPEEASDEEKLLQPRPTPAVAEAFQRLRDRGHATFICTGRAASLVPASVLALEPTGLVAAAGSYLSVGDEVVYEKVIPRDLLEATLHTLADAGMEVLLEGRQQCVAFMSDPTRSWEVPGIETVSTVDELAAVSDMRFSKFSYRDDMLERLAPIRPVLEEDFILFDLGLGSGEACLKGVDKGYGVRRAVEALGVDPARTFGFGDSENDLPMLAAVAHPVAMGNALPQVKEACSYVTAPVDEDGVVTALEHFGLI